MKTVNIKKKPFPVWEVTFLLALAAAVLTGALCLKTQDNLAEKVVRLHVLANSDSQEDQTLKLQVRDAVIERCTQLLESSGDREEAREHLLSALPELEALAQEEVWLRGYDYGVKVELADTEFPTKEYDDFTLPAGEYLALRVLIGQAQGQNWWCVVFPPLCTAASAQVPASALAAGLSEEEVKLITEEDEGYVLKFKAIEFWETLRQKLNAS